VVEMLVVSNIVLWTAVVVLAMVTLALARQVGILHERIGPAGALPAAKGPKVGESTLEIPLIALDGRPVSIGGTHHAGLATLVLFISPTCAVCKSLVPAAKTLANSERRRLRLVFASDGNNLERHQAYARDLSLSGFPYVLSQELGLNYEVSKLPYALLIGADGTLKNKGLVHTADHLQNLVATIDTEMVGPEQLISGVDADYDPAPLKQSS